MGSLAGGALILAACGASPAAPPTTAAEPNAAGAAPQATTADSAVSAATVPAATGRRLQKLTFLAGSALPAPTPRESNSYWQAIEERVGVEIDFQFVPTDQYNEKLSVVLASGDLPDCLSGNPTQPVIRRAIQDGAFLKLGDFGLPADTRGLPGLATIPDFSWKNSSFNGEVYGLPTPGQRFQEGNFLRLDWIDKLGMQQPATVAELKELLEAFAKRDPDGNGADDTLGFSIGQQRAGWRLFTTSFGVPQNWKFDANGNLVHMDISPEMRAALAFMREVYATGALNPDFTTLSNQDSYKDFTAGLSGGISQNLASGYDLQGAQLREVVPDAVVYPISPPIAEGFTPATYFRPGYNTVTQINAKYADDPELVWELLRVLDFWLDPATEQFVNFGFEGEHHTVNDDGTLTQTEKGAADIGWIRAWSPRHYLKYVDAPYVTAEHRAQIIKDTERLSAFAVEDPTWGIYPELGGDDPSARLTEMATQTFERIVRGEEPLEAFDSFVEEWKSQGGQMLTDRMAEKLREVRG